MCVSLNIVKRSFHFGRRAEREREGGGWSSANVALGKLRRQRRRRWQRHWVHSKELSEKTWILGAINVLVLKKKGKRKCPKDKKKKNYKLIDSWNRVFGSCQFFTALTEGKQMTQTPVVFTLAAHWLDRLFVWPQDMRKASHHPSITRKE